MQVVDPKTIARDLETGDVTVVGGNGSGPVVIYTNNFKGKSYFHIRSVWQNDKGKWCPGKGLALDPAYAKTLLTALGQAASSY